MKVKCLFIYLILLGISASVSAQEMYRTTHGDIAISINLHDSILLMVSNKLSVTLDYETSKVGFRVPYESFSTRIDSIDSKLRAMKGQFLEITGKLGITINTQNFNPQRYNIEAVLTGAIPPLTLRGNGSMSCLPSGDRVTPACTLLVSLETNLTALHLKDIFPGAEEGIRIDVRQSILERDNE